GPAGGALRGGSKSRAGLRPAAREESPVTTPAKKNPIERRLDEVRAHWDQFAEQPEARLLCWQADGDDARLVEVFLEVQRHGGDVPDLFIRFNTPFLNPAGFG